MNTSFAKSGEDLAAKFLKEKGFTVLERNYRWRRGEIDIIARKSDLLAFIEVKTWNAYNSFELERAVNKKKQKTILEGSKIFINTNFSDEWPLIRYDILLVKPDSGEILHYENAFTENGTS